MLGPRVRGVNTDIDQSTFHSEGPQSLDGHRVVGVESVLEKVYRGPLVNSMQNFLVKGRSGVLLDVVCYR